MNPDSASSVQSAYLVGVSTKPSLAHAGLHRLVLTAAPKTNAPTLLRWARAGYSSANREGTSIGKYLEVFADGFNLGIVIAECLMRGTVPVEIVDDETLHVLLTDQQHQDFVSRLKGVSVLGDATLLSAP